VIIVADVEYIIYTILEKDEVEVKRTEIHSATVDETSLDYELLYKKLTDFVSVTGKTCKWINIFEQVLAFLGLIETT
jgi:hypothetical protein